MVGRSGIARTALDAAIAEKGRDGTAEVKRSRITPATAGALDVYAKQPDGAAVSDAVVARAAAASDQSLSRKGSEPPRQATGARAGVRHHHVSSRKTRRGTS